MICGLICLQNANILTILFSGLSCDDRSHTLGTGSPGGGRGALILLYQLETPAGGGQTQPEFFMAMLTCHTESPT